MNEVERPEPPGLTPGQRHQWRKAQDYRRRAHALKPDDPDALELTAWAVLIENEVLGLHTEGER